MKENFCTDKDFLKKYFNLAIMLIIQQAIVLSVNLLDNVMIGSYTEYALAGVTIANQIHFVLQGMLNALATGVTILGSQYWGKGDKSEVEHVASTGLFVCLGVAILVFILVWVIPGSIVSIFTKDPLVAVEAVAYLKAIKWSYPFFATSLLLLATMRSVGTVKIAVVVSIISLIVNCGLNYTLIFGHFGAPELGSQGAAIATAVARILETFIIGYYVFRKEKKLCMKLSELFRPRFDNLGRYLGVALPIMVAEGTFCCGNAAQSVVLGNFSTTALAANSMANAVYQLVKVMGIGAANAAAVVMGQAVPKGKKYAVSCANTLQVIFVCVGVLMAVVLYFIRIPVLSMYNVSDETRQLADQFMKLLCIIGFCMSYQMSCNCGITRGGGDPKFVMYVDLIAIWLVVIPLSFLAAFKFKWPPIIIMLCLNIDQILKIIPAAIKVNSHTWYKDLTE